MFFARFDSGWRGDLEDEGIFVPRLSVLTEEVLVNKNEASDGNFFPGFFLELAAESAGGGFAWLDVAAGEIPIV